MKDNCGLSRAAIAGAVFGVLVLMGAIVAFLLIALRVWDNQGSFAATVQSCIIGGAGALQRKLNDFELKEEDIDKILDSEFSQISNMGTEAAAGAVVDGAANDEKAQV